MTTISLHSRYNDHTATVTETLDGIRNGSIWANHRIARQIIPLLIGADAQCIHEHEGGRKLCIVDSGITIDEFRSWKEAILFFA